MRSMKRPSRRLRESVATMLKNGRFLAPPRAKRITTIIVPKSVLRRKKVANYSAPDRVVGSDTCMWAKLGNRRLSPDLGRGAIAACRKKPARPRDYGRYCLLSRLFHSETWP